MAYTILQNEMLPVALQNKSRCVACLVCTAGLFVITLSAVTVGAFVGYTYCYVEHRTGFRTGDVRLATKFEVVSLPSKLEATNKNTINSVLFSPVLISRLYEMGRSFKDDVTHLPSTSSKTMPSIDQENVTSKI